MFEILLSGVSEGSILDTTLFSILMNVFLFFLGGRGGGGG